MSEWGLQMQDLIRTVPQATVLVPQELLQLVPVHFWPRCQQDEPSAEKFA